MRRVRALLLSARARPLRAICTGSLAALCQIALLALLTGHHWPPVPADIAALIFGAQVNFWLSYVFTWHDRRPPRRAPILVLRWWAAYQVAASGAMVLNILIFLAAHSVLPTLVAALVGTNLTALVSFVLNDRLVFQPGLRAIPIMREDDEHADSLTREA
jgi:putative flippase GtrA